MKTSTLIIATIALLSISSASFAQTSFLTLNVANNEVANVTPSIRFNPLGIANGVVKVKMFNQPTGTYTLQVMDANGTVLSVKEINHTNGSTTEVADFARTFAGGTYQLQVISPNNTKTSQTIMLLI